MRWVSLCFTLSFLCGFAVAEPAVHPDRKNEVFADLNQDGLNERFVLVADEDGAADLLIELGASNWVLAPDILWKGSLAGQTPYLSFSETGRLLLVSENQGCCATRWRKELTIGFQDGRYNVTRMIYSWRDTVDLDNFGTCDVSFVARQGTLKIGSAEERQFRIRKKTLALTKWRDDTPLPRLCRNALVRG